MRVGRWGCVPFEAECLSPEALLVEHEVSLIEDEYLDGIER